MDLPIPLFFGAFPLLFGGMWLLVTTILSRLSGWPALSRRFPDRPEVAQRTLRFVSGFMGAGVRYGNCLTLAACPGGLRVGIMRLFGPFDRPFFVPWGELRVERRPVLFGERAILSFGEPVLGRLQVSGQAADQLAVAAAASWPEPAVSRGAPIVSR